MIQIRFSGFHRGLPCFVVEDYEEAFTVEVVSEGERLSSGKVGLSLFEFSFALGVHDTVRIEQHGVAVFELVGEGVEA